MLPELRQQVPLMKELLTAMNITIVEKEGFEADDILGTIAKNSQKQGIDVSIVSGDRDLLQVFNLLYLIDVNVVFFEHSLVELGVCLQVGQRLG